MPHSVRCDVCGKLLNSSTVKSHKRLAHAKAILVVASEEDALPTIMRIYKTLSAEKRREVLTSLARFDSDPA